MTRTGSFALIAVLGLCAVSAAAVGGIVGIGGVGGIGGGRVAEADETLDPNVDRIELAVSSGDVQISGANVDRIEVHEQVRHWMGRPDRTFHVDGDTLTLDDDACGWGCGVEYTIRVPAGTTVSGSTTSGTVEVENVAAADVELTSGDLRLARITGSVRAEATSGTISVERIDGDLELRTSSGDIEGERLAGGSVDARASSGDVDLELTDPRTVQVEASSGEVELTVPDFPYQLTTNVGSGDVHTNGLRQDDSADRTLDIRTGSGDIDVELDRSRR